VIECSDPRWASLASGSGLVSKMLLLNADTMCAVASPLMDPEDTDNLMIGFHEKCVMNNYFGIGIDAKITLDFHLKRCDWSFCALETGRRFFSEL